MTILNLPWGEVFVCTREEARKIWKNQPEDRGKIWLPGEVSKYLLADSAEVKAAYNKKLTDPGCEI